MPKMTSHNEEDMDVNRLASITADAISTVLFFHTKQITPPADIRHAGLDRAIQANFHLRSRAADITLANLEIACDASLSYADDYNEIHPANTIKPRWMYMCVQALLSYRISPAVVQVEGGRVERLKDWIPRIKDLKAKQEKRLSSSDPGLVDDDGPTMSSIEVPTTPSSQGSMELDDDDGNMASGDEGNNDNDDVDADDDEAASGQVVRHALVGGVIKSTPKMPWTEEDIRFLIELRAMGMTHMQTADYLDRGQGAVENKYGRVVNDRAWQPYVTECKARYSKFRGEKGKCKLPLPLGHSDIDEADEEEDEYDEDEDWEAMRRRAVKRQRESTLAAVAELE